MGRAYFMVRAEVPEAERAAFDRWYEIEHLPDAVKTFKAVRAWRCCGSTTSPAARVCAVAFPM